MLKASNLHYELAGRGQAVSCGGIGVLHLLVQRLGLSADLNQHLKLLKGHLPFHFRVVRVFRGSFCCGF